MEEMQGSRLARRTSNGEARSACGRGARLVSSNGSRIDDYVEIFGGFAASCSIPVLVLPEAINGCEEELAGSQTCGLNYLDIFGALDAGSFTLAYEDLLSMEKVSKEEGEEDSSFQEETDVGHVVIGASEFVGPELPGMHITFSEVNPISANCHSVFETEQLKFSVGSNQLNTEDEVNSTVCICKPQAICKHNIEAETTFPIGFVENNSLRKVTGDEHFLNGYIGKEKQSQKPTKEILDRCFVSATVEGSENDLKEAHKPLLKDTTCDLKQHSRSSSYHSTSSWDIPFSDHAFLTISDINLRTQPLEVPPPSRAPPKLDMKPEMSKSETLEASTITFNKNYQDLHVGGALICHALKETLNNTSIHSNTEMDAGRTAAASSAAMLEAMELAQARLKSAKELMERKRESDRRLGHHDFFIRNGQNYICTEDPMNKAKKEHMKFSNQEERVASALSEDCGEAVQGKNSRSYKQSAEKEMSQHWKVDKQFFELVSSEMFVRGNVINQVKFNNNEDIKLTHQHDAYPYIPKKESLVNHEHMFLQNGDAKEGENVVRNLNKFRINEMKLPSVGELQLQDVSAKNLKSGILIEKEIINIFETSSYGDDEGRAKTGQALQVPDINTKKLVDTFFLLQQDGNENEPKKCQESLQCSDSENNTESDAKPNIACGMMSGSVSIDFCRDSNHAEFDSGEASEQMMEQDKEIKTFTSEVEEISDASVVFEYDTFRSNECMAMNNGKVTSECGFYIKLKGDQASSLKNEIDEEVDIENWISCSSEKDKNLKANREESQPGRQTRKETCTSYNDGKNSDLFCFDNTSGQGTATNRDINKSNEPEKKQRAKWNIPNKSELDAAKFLFHPVCSATAKESLKFLHSEEINVFELPQKLENSDDRASVVREEVKDEKNILGKVQATLELEKTIMGFGVRIKDSEAVQQAYSLNINGKNMNPSVDTSRSSLKQMEKRMPGVRRSVNNRNKESFCGERTHEVEQKRKLEEEKEREREREKDMIAVGKATQEGCERVFAETRERPEIVMGERVSSETLSSPIKAYRDIAERPLSDVFERSQKIASEAKLRSERAAVERATMEARERAIERALAEQSLLAARKHTETSVNASNDKNLKLNETEGNAKQGDNGSVDNHKPTSVLHDTSTDMNSSQTEDREGESPLRCKARQERCRRIVERAAKALAEKNMRDLVAQREQAERNRLAEPLDADVRRWSSGKEGNLRALLSTLQYILGHDSGWQPIPLTEVITAAAVKKAYRKATLYLHPDKLQQRGASIQQKYICEKVFDLLKDAWNKYNSERW